MLNKEDYEEPRCLLCMEDGDAEKTDTRRLARKLDEFYARDDMQGAERFLLGWLDESLQTNDERLEFFARNELIGVYRKTGRKDESLLHADKAMELAEKLGAADRGDGAYAFINAATAYKAFGYPEVAVMLFERIQPVCERDVAEAYALGSFYNNMALSLCDVGRFEDARERYEKALEVMRAEKGGEAEAAITYLNLADLEQMEKGENADVSSLLEKARASLESENNVQNANFAFVCSKCAPVFAHYGMETYAKELENRARRIYERA